MLVEAVVEGKAEASWWWFGCESGGFRVVVVARLVLTVGCCCSMVAVAIGLTVAGVNFCVFNFLVSKIKQNSALL